MRVSLIGDFNPEVVAHQAIPKAIELAADELELDVEHEWIRTTQVDPQQLVDADAIWCVPLSPYENPDNVLAAIRIAREHDIPFLGTCAGYQHAALEYARNVLGYQNAGSIEDSPDTSMPLIAALTCGLSGESDAINMAGDTQISAIYQQQRIVEEYNCGFGVNRDYLSIFEDSDMRFSGFDDGGDPRILEIPTQRFFIGTAFQPERSAFKAMVHPLVSAFLRASA